MLWLGAAALLGILAARRLGDGIDRVERIRSTLDIASVAGGEAADQFALADDDFEAASRYLRSPVLTPARFLPVVGRHLDAVRALSAAAGEVATAAERAVRDASALVEDPPGAGQERLRVLRELQTVLASARNDITDLDLGPDEGLAGPIASRRATFERELAEAQATLDKASAGLRAADAFLTGPSRYLLLVASNAEMRAGSGSFLSVGVLEATGGGIGLGDVQPTGDLTLDDAVPIDDADLEARWGAFEPNREWRNLMMSPRFDASATLAASMWEARTGEHVDGVLALDVEAVRAVLEATGAVQVGGRSLGAEDVVDFLLHDQYVEGGAELGGSQEARRDELGEIAKAAVAAIEEGDFSVGDLARGVGEAAGGRHLLAWSGDTTVNDGWRAAGATGEVTRDDMLLAVINRGANKLDPFLGVNARVDRHDERLTVRIEIENRTPDGEIAYIAGPNPDTGTTYGEYKGIVALTVPGFASEIGIDGVDPVAVAGRDGAGNVIGGEVRVLPGASVTVTVRFDAPAGAPITVLPSARIPPVTWHVNGVTWTDVDVRTMPVGPQDGSGTADEG